MTKDHRTIEAIEMDIADAEAILSQLRAELKAAGLAATKHPYEIGGRVRIARHGKRYDAVVSRIEPCSDSVQLYGHRINRDGTPAKRRTYLGMWTPDGCLNCEIAKISD